MPIRDTSTDKPDDGAPTTSTSATDASTTEGRANALGSVSTTAAKPPAEAPAAGTADQLEPVSTSTPPADPQRVIIEQPPAEPAVFYGEGGQVPGSGTATDPNRPHVQAKYEPFEW